jgi:peptide deformylase
MRYPKAPIVAIDDPMMSAPSETVGVVDDAIRTLAAEMFSVMDDFEGAGLAAVQIGKPIRLIVTDIADGSGTKRRMAMVNPEIVAASEGKATSDEGCLSMPGIYMPVERHENVLVRWLDLDGVEREELATGRWAVCVQHEIDHTEGVVIYDRVSRLRRDRAKTQFKKDRARHAER